jgi:hypothetical protein
MFFVDLTLSTNLNHPSVGAMNISAEKFARTGL